MNCDEFETHLNGILDERRRPEWDGRLRDHAGHCAACRDLAAGYATLFEGFFALPLPEVSADLPQRVLAELQIQPIASPTKLTRRDGVGIVAALFSTAAAVLVAFLLTRDGATIQPVAQAPAAQAPAVAAAEPAESVKVDLQKLEQVPLIGPAMASAGDNDPKTDPYERLAKDAGQGLAQIVLVLPGVAGPGGVRPPSPSINGSGLWPAQVAEELRPVTESMSETFNLLLDALPLTVSSTSKSRAS